MRSIANTARALHVLAPPRALLALTLLLSLDACIYDTDDVCNYGEQQNQLGLCECSPGHIPDLVQLALPGVTPENPNVRNGCSPCQEHSTPADGACVCDVGFEEDAAGACVASNLAAACMAAADCAGGSNPACEMGLLGGYCTKRGCATDADCNVSAGWVCAMGMAGTFCRKPPDGVGAACTFPQMAAPPHEGCTPEAPLCWSSGCSAPCAVDADCSAGRSCCDVSAVAMQPLSLCLLPERCPL